MGLPRRPSSHVTGELLDSWSGSAALSDEELLSALLAVARGSRAGRRVARALFDRFGDLPEVCNATEYQVRDLGRTVFPLLETVRRLIMRYSEAVVRSAPIALGTGALSDLWRGRLGLLRFEAFEVAYLDASRRLVPQGLRRLSAGTVGKASVYPRRGLEGALRYEAAGVVLAHNHTNGDVTPTSHDLALTRSIVLSAELLDLAVYDHLIVSRGSVFSFRDAGLI